jgi:hypothetical protein
MIKIYNKWIGIAILLSGIFIQGGGLPAFAGQYVLADRQAAAISDLDAMRGGFVTDVGLQFTLGITKAVLIDGVLQTISTLNIPNVASITNNGTAKNPASASGNNTPTSTTFNAAFPQDIGNASTVVMNFGNYGTLVQNTANNKLIQNMTIVNLTTNSASILRQVNFMSNVNQQLINMLH